jgi:hypothetical protein
MNVLEILAVVVIVGFVIGRQLLGEPLRGKRLLVLPAVLVVIGAVELFGSHEHPGSTAIGLIAVGAVVAAVIGAAQGSMMRLESRQGTLWGQMPRRSLWLWVALIASRLVIEGLASGLGAHMAGSGAAIFLTLGVNRLAQAAVVAPRAMASGIPFAPEKDGSTFLAGVFGAGPGHGGPDTSSPPSRQGNGFLSDEWRSGVRMIADRLADRQQR